MFATIFYTTLFKKIIGIFIAQSLASHTLLWDANPESENVHHYSLRVWKVVGGATNVINVTNATSVVVTNLQVGKEYRFWCTAVSADGTESESYTVLTNIITR